MEAIFFSWRQAVLKSKLESTTKHVLVTLGCHMNEMGESCFPTIETLCEETSLSNRAVITHLKKAEEAGFIRTSKHGFAGRKWARNEYVATFPQPIKVVNDVHHLVDEVVNLVQQGSERDDIKVVNDVHTSTSINSSINNTAREWDSGSSQSYSTPHGEYACRLIKMDVKVSSMHPTLCQWVTDHIPIDFIEQCVGLARQSKPQGSIAANYLDAIVRSELKPKQDNSWMHTEKGWIAKGKEFGVTTRSGELWPDFKKRVSEAIKGVKGDRK